MTTSGILLRREDVRLALREMDPENVDKRQHWNPGLSYVWHTDCYDKLKPYGISFHGCIDVFFGALFGWKLHRLIKYLN